MNGLANLSIKNNYKSHLSLLIIILSFLLLPASRIQAQLKYQPHFFQDSITNDKPKTKGITPKTILWRSAIIPGWGQATNKQYYKIPIVYAAIGGGGYFINYNLNQYKDLRDAYRIRIDDDESTIDKYDPNNPDAEETYTDDYLKYRRDKFRKNLELSIIVTTALYALNIIDAYVSAHLRDFDISDDLSLGLNYPIIYNFAGQNYNTFCITLNF